MIEEFRLKELLSEDSCTKPIDIKRRRDIDYKRALLDMMTIRAVENKLAYAKRDGIIRGPVHLGVGQEAVAVGVSTSLKSSDKIFGAHRSHSHILALGTDLKKLFAEILGKESGLASGMGGSMHLLDKTVGFYGSVPIVAGTVPLAVGAAMASRLLGNKNISVAYFGDGACEEGVVHECLNLAAVQKDPILFVVENNLFASHMHISLRQTAYATARFAVANNIEYRIVDGNDIGAVSEATEDLVSNARNGDGPGFLETITYRWYGHVDWREDVDVGVNRSKGEIEKWKKRDPIRRLKEGMINEGIWSESMHQESSASISNTIEEEWKQAINDRYPDKSMITKNVYEAKHD